MAETATAMMTTMGEDRDITMAATETETKTETGALDTNDSSGPAKLRKVVRVDHCGAGDGS